MMSTLPINNSSALQLNPNLGMILASDMEGWFQERFINIFMNGTIIDYVDNVNYAGVINGERYYCHSEVEKYGVINIIETEVDRNNFIHLWVDEISIPNSVRFQKEHFVHPLMIYGYDAEQHICKTVFFDIRKGQVLIDISYHDLIEATDLAGQFYHIGGTDDAINKTLSSYKLSGCVNGCFHLDVFARQLSNYLCCKSESCMEWYTTSRPGVFNSNKNIFGIQIYAHLIKLLQSPAHIDISYKTLHDFVAHKKQLLNRFIYVHENYDMPPKYYGLIEQFASNWRCLEQVRLLNLKRQIKSGNVPTTLCLDVDYINKLIETLEYCYNIEMAILPQIYECIVNIKQSKIDCNSVNTIYLSNCRTNIIDNCFEYSLPELDMCVWGIEIIRRGECFMGKGFEYVLINNQTKIYLERDSLDHLPVRILKTGTALLRNFKIYTDVANCSYDVKLYSSNNQLDSDGLAININENWVGDHHIKRIQNGKDEAPSLVLTGEDPFIIRENLCIDASEYRYIHVRMKSSAKTIYAQIFFATLDYPHFSMNNSLFFKIIPDKQEHSYYINMAHNELWCGYINAIRLDPAQFFGYYPWNNDVSSSCTIKSVSILKQLPGDVDECMIAHKLDDDYSTFL